MLDEQLRLYALLVDQVQKYNSIVWQIPTALVAADVLAVQQVGTRPLALLGVAVVSTALTFAYYRMVVAQGTLIAAAREAETVLREQHATFVPAFVPSVISARWVVVAALVIFNLGFITFAVVQAGVGLQVRPVNRVALSLWVTLAGYGLASAGTVLLFVGTPEDVGIGRIPVVSGAGDFFARQERAIARRRQFTKLGFGGLMVGMLLQLLGFLAVSF